MVLRFFTIDDVIYKNSINVVSSVTTDSPYDSPVVVGGTAVQMYASKLNVSELYRPTCDIDLHYLPSVSSWQEFSLGIGGQMEKLVKSKGYQCQLKKGRNLYEVKIMNGQNNNAKELFFIHFDQDIGVTSDVNKMQSENSDIFEFENKQLYIERVEDLLVRKIRRIGLNIKQISASPVEGTIYLQAERGDWKSLSKYPSVDWVDNLTTMQNDFPDDLHLPPKRYSVNKDLFDICLMSRYIEGFPGSYNKSYFLELKSILLK
jgi:hypothetical protein